MVQISGIKHLVCDTVERITYEGHASHSAVIKVGKCRINLFDAVNIAIDRPKHIRVHRQSVDEVVRSIGFDHDEFKRS